ncbi:MAG TPA: hypothetical protein VFU45_05165, partial [Gemmatimonadales bacterium]|nr:hypothetical protein [Gemmatimonadales bacterium]
MDGRDVAMDPSSLPTIAGARARAGRRPSLDLDDSRSIGERVFEWLLVTVWLGVAVTTFAYGLPYYRLPLAARATSPMDELLRPSGLIGQGYG